MQLRIVIGTWRCVVQDCCYRLLHWCNPVWFSDSGKRSNMKRNMARISVQSNKVWTSKCYRQHFWRTKTTQGCPVSFWGIKQRLQRKHSNLRCASRGLCEDVQEGEASRNWTDVVEMEKMRNEVQRGLRGLFRACPSASTERVGLNFETVCLVPQASARCDY